MRVKRPAVVYECRCGFPGTSVCPEHHITGCPMADRRWPFTDQERVQLLNARKDLAAGREPWPKTVRVLVETAPGAGWQGHRGQGFHKGGRQ